jgi:ABC-2 type transport system permease protein
VTGLWPLLHLALRRDRRLVTATAVLFGVVVAASALATGDLYPTAVGRAAAARAVNATPALVAVYGPVHDVGSRGALTFFKLTVLGAALVALLASLLVIRHTRADEEVGRTELLAAGAVAREAPLTAAVIVAVLASAAVGALTAVAAVATGYSARGSLALGAGWCCTGVAFAGIAAVAAQVATSARTARGLVLAALAAAYVVRGAGDASGRRGLIWASPLGWAEEVRPFAGDRWQPLLLLVLLGLLAAAVGLALLHRRDLGAGLLPDRPGPERGELASTGALAWRLHRGGTLAWLVGATLAGGLLGNLVTQLGGFLNNPAVLHYLERLGGTSVASDAFLATDFQFLALAVTGYALSAVVRMRAEEATGRLELLLAASGRRVRWASGHVSLAALGATGILAAAGLAAGLMHAQRSGDRGDVWRDAAGLLARAPAVWMLLGAGCLLFGLRGRWTGLSWALLVGALVVGELGDLMGLPSWLRACSPFSHVPALPGGTLDRADWTALVVMSLLAALLAAGGVAAFRRRDLSPD